MWFFGARAGGGGAGGDDAWRTAAVSTRTCLANAQPATVARRGGENSEANMLIIHARKELFVPYTMLIWVHVPTVSLVCNCLGGGEVAGSLEGEGGHSRGGDGA